MDNERQEETVTLTEVDGNRDAQGRFVAGNTCGQGRIEGSRNKITTANRKLFLDSTTDNEREALRVALYEAAVNGDVNAMKAYLTFDMGAPSSVVTHEGAVGVVGMSLEQWQAEAKARREAIGD